MRPNNIHLHGLIRNFADLTLEDLMQYVRYIAELPQRDNSELLKLDDLCGRLQSHASTLSILVKNRYLFVDGCKSSADTGTTFTRDELAARFNVCRRTVQNWISNGLETTGPNGSHITEVALKAFIERNRTKKFAWRSKDIRNQYGQFTSPKD